MPDEDSANAVGAPSTAFARSAPPWRVGSRTACSVRRSSVRADVRPLARPSIAWQPWRLLLSDVSMIGAGPRIRFAQRGRRYCRYPARLFRHNQIGMGSRPPLEQSMRSCMAPRRSTRLLNEGHNSYPSLARIPRMVASCALLAASPLACRGGSRSGQVGLLHTRQPALRSLPSPG